MLDETEMILSKRKKDKVLSADTKRISTLPTKIAKTTEQIK